jgi:mono/diheme cytochrome c family protein
MNPAQSPTVSGFTGGMMMGTYLTCASCHGPEARGGIHQMHMQVMDAPDIRYIALSSEADEHAEEGEDQHEDEHAGYDLEDFRLAVIEGRHPTGAPLSSDMPRWRISDTDLADLFAYLKAIP